MNSIPYGYVYKITNKLNGKTYIGSRKLSKDKSWRQYMGSGVLITQAVEKYGKENFIKTLIEYCFNDGEELLKIESHHISKHKKRGEANYNLSMGYSGGDTLKNKEENELNAIRLRQSLGVRNAISEGRAVSKVVEANRKKYNEYFSLNGKEILDFYEKCLSVSKTAKNFNIPMRRLEQFLRDNNITPLRRNITGVKRSEPEKDAIRMAINKKVMLKSGESLEQCHGRLIKSQESEFLHLPLKDQYIRLNVSKKIYNRFIRDHNKDHCDYCQLL